MRNGTAEALRSVAAHLDRIVHKIDVEERCMFDDDVIVLVEEINFTELAKLLHVSAAWIERTVPLLKAVRGYDGPLPAYVLDNIDAAIEKAPR